MGSFDAPLDPSWAKLVHAADRDDQRRTPREITLSSDASTWLDASSLTADSLASKPPSRDISSLPSDVPSGITRRTDSNDTACS
jgi:hypothetical protein